MPDAIALRRRLWWHLTLIAGLLTALAATAAASASSWSASALLLGLPLCALAIRARSRSMPLHREPAIETLVKDLGKDPQAGPYIAAVRRQGRQLTYAELDQLRRRAAPLRNRA